MNRSRPDLALVEIDSGALLLNLKTGVLFQLNDSAAFVWKGLLEGQGPDAIAAAFERRYGLAASDAWRDVAASQAMDLSQPATLLAPSLGFHYESADGGYLFSFHGQPIFCLDERGMLLRPADASQPLGDRLDFFLQAIVPKVAALRGCVVLHASAFIGASGEVTAICGASGAGKTTTACLSAAAGAKLVSQDKLVLSFRDDRVLVALEGERRLEAWVASASASVAAHGSARCEEIDAACAGPVKPIERILFIDASRRSGDGIQLQVMDRVTAAASLFHNSFYGSDRDDDWRRILANCAQVARTVPMHLATMPAGLPALRAAAESLAAGSLRSK